MPTFYASGQSQVTTAVQRAIEDIRVSFAGHDVEASADGGGGTYIVIADIELSGRFSQDTTWLGFQISYLYPASDVYPHYVRSDLALMDGSQLGPGYSSTIWGNGGVPAIQVSRRSSRWNPNIDTAALKAAKVIAWINRGA